MKLRLISVLSVILLTNSLFSQRIPLSLQQKTVKIINEKQILAPHLKKIHCQILNKIIQSRKFTQQAEPFWQVNAQGKMHVTVRTKEITPALLSKLNAIGFEVEKTTEKLNVSSNHQMITGWASREQIEDIARLSQIFYIRPTDRPIHNSGEVTTAGDYILRVAEARQSFGVSGMSQKVGVLSDGIDHSEEVQATRDLPEIDVVKNRFAGDEGTAMLEIVHDLAPRAELAFADWGDSQIDFATNIIMLKDAGCTIMTDDITYLLEPVYEDGVIAQTIDQIVENFNVVYTSSAGNLQHKHYEGDFSDKDGNGFHEFDTNVDETLNTSVAASRTLLVVMQWNNQFGKALDNYDLYIYDESLENILALGNNIQDGDDDPVEYATYENSSSSTKIVNVSINKASGMARNLTLHFWEYSGEPGVDPLEYVDVNGTIFGHAAAKHCLAVGAIYANDPGHDTIEYYSSHGPARIYQYNERGRPVSYEVREKPDHVAIDGVETQIGKLGYFHDPFFGTSAATPHTAGIAALIREAAFHLTASEVNDLINHTCVDLGDSGFDDEFGYGRIDALNAISSLGTAPRIQVTPDSFSLFKKQVDGTLTISNRGDLTLHFELSSSELFQTVKAIDLNLSHLSNKSISHISNLPQPKRSEYFLSQINTSAVVLLQEGFESGAMPPAGWQKIDGNSRPGKEPAHWRIEDHASYVFNGNYSAFCPYGFNLDEWLITPALDFESIESAEMKFYWQSSYHWHVAPNDNGDLFVKVSTDNGTTWTTLWTFGEIGEWSNWTWYETTINLSNYAGQPAVMFAFHVVADDNADIALDEIKIMTDDSQPNWIIFNPQAGKLSKDSTQIIDLKFRTDDVMPGNYHGEIYITNNDPDDSLITIPVNLMLEEKLTYAINGKVTYYSDSTAIDSALLQLSNGFVDSTFTDSLGNFEFQNISRGNYIIKAIKDGSFKPAITAEDASLILQYDVRLISLNPYQKIAGDVSGNNRVTHFDASLILRYCVGSIEEFPKNNGWIFIPADFTIANSNWFNAPDSINYRPLDSDAIDQNFKGIIYGDVNGDWKQSKNNIIEVYPTVELGKSNPLSQNTITVPININHENEIFSGELELIYNNTSLKLNAVRQADLQNATLFESSLKDEKIKIAFASGNGVSTSGSFFNVEFEVLNEHENFVKLNSVILNGKEYPITSTIKEFISHSEIPAEFKLNQNYPNPFNPTTQFNYQIPQRSRVSIVIYNMLGQNVRTLIDQDHEAGFYEIIWNGADDHHQQVGSGIYFYQIQANGFLETKKMVLIR